VIDLLVLAAESTFAEDVQSLVLDANLLVAGAIAFAAGVVSFASPCVLPLVPGYVSYMTGLSGEDLEQGRGRHKGQILLGSVLFVIGFAVPFMLLGAFAATANSFFFLQQNTAARWVMGGIVVLLGVLMATGWLTREFRFMSTAPTRGVLTAPVFGFVFGVGWTPCVGPALGAILTMSANSGGTARGGALGMVYALGLGLPFILAALLFRRFAGTLDWLKQRSRRIQQVGGAALVVLGVMIATGLWDVVIRELYPLVSGFRTVL
jgi:cytochrome c-type biogenesis protein